MTSTCTRASHEHGPIARGAPPGNRDGHKRTSSKGCVAAAPLLPLRRRGGGSSSSMECLAGPSSSSIDAGPSSSSIEPLGPSPYGCVGPSYGCVIKSSCPWVLQAFPEGVASSSDDDWEEESEESRLPGDARCSLPTAFRHLRARLALRWMRASSEESEESFGWACWQSIIKLLQCFTAHRPSTVRVSRSPACDEAEKARTGLQRGGRRSRRRGLPAPPARKVGISMDALWRAYHDLRQSDEFQRDVLLARVVHNVLDVDGVCVDGGDSAHAAR
ncbi:hypothetical protein M885DRAFT_82615 [Pelagophyceae sp. CCMP2097]|nr:hypothetical protein M885DRAFT_82615 [Pelagophyceae sp. CCMP2097]